VSVAEARTQ